MEDKPEIVIEDRIRSTGEHVHKEYLKGKLLGKVHSVGLRGNSGAAGVEKRTTASQSGPTAKARRRFADAGDGG